MRSVLQWNQDWYFWKSPYLAAQTIPADAWPVDLPHTWNGIDGQDGGNDYFRSSCCYAKRIRKAELPEENRYFLELNGANSSLL